MPEPVLGPDLHAVIASLLPPAGTGGNEDGNTKQEFLGEGEEAEVPPLSPFKGSSPLPWPANNNDHDHEPNEPQQAIPPLSIKEQDEASRAGDVNEAGPGNDDSRLFMTPRETTPNDHDNDNDQVAQPSSSSSADAASSPIGEGEEEMKSAISSPKPVDMGNGIEIVDDTWSKAPSPPLPASKNARAKAKLKESNVEAQLKLDEKTTGWSAKTSQIKTEDDQIYSNSSSFQTSKPSVQQTNDESKSKTTAPSIKANPTFTENPLFSKPSKQVERTTSEPPPPSTQSNAHPPSFNSLPATPPQSSASPDHDVVSGWKRSRPNTTTTYLMASPSTLPDHAMPQFVKKELEPVSLGVDARNKESLFLASNGEGEEEDGDEPIVVISSRESSADAEPMYTARGRPLRKRTLAELDQDADALLPPRKRRPTLKAKQADGERKKGRKRVKEESGPTSPKAVADATSPNPVADPTSPPPVMVDNDMSTDSPLSSLSSLSSDEANLGAIHWNGPPASIDPASLSTPAAAAKAATAMQQEQKLIDFARQSLYYESGSASSASSLLSPLNGETAAEADNAHVKQEEITSALNASWDSWTNAASDLYAMDWNLDREHGAGDADAVPISGSSGSSRASSVAPETEPKTEGQSPPPFKRHGRPPAKRRPPNTTKKTVGRPKKGSDVIVDISSSSDSEPEQEPETGTPDALKDSPVWPRHRPPAKPATTSLAMLTSGPPTPSDHDYASHSDEYVLPSEGDLDASGSEIESSGSEKESDLKRAYLTLTAKGKRGGRPVTAKPQAKPVKAKTKTTIKTEAKVKEVIDVRDVKEVKPAAKPRGRPRLNTPLSSASAAAAVVQPAVRRGLRSSQAAILDHAVDEAVVILSDSDSEYGSDRQQASLIAV